MDLTPLPRQDQVKLRFARVRILLLFVILLILCLNVSARAETVYRVGVEDVQYYPLQEFTAAADQGIMAEILRNFASQSGVKFEFIPLPIHRMNTWYQDKSIDFRVPDHPSWTAESQPNLHYSKPMVKVCETTIVLAKNKDLAMSSFSRIGTLHGFTPSQKWHKKIAKGEVELVSDASLKVLTKMLLNEMVDGLDVDINVVRHQLKGLELPENTFVVSSGVPHSVLSYRMSTIEHPEMLTRFDEFLINNKSLLDQIAEAYEFSLPQPCANISTSSAL